VVRQVKSLLPALVGNAVFLGILLVSADRTLLACWVYLGTSLLMTVLTRSSCGATRARAGTRPAGPGAKDWDKRLLGLGLLLRFALLVVAGSTPGACTCRRA
jgi:hypothetical protein